MKIVSDSLKNAVKKPTTQRKGRILVNDTYYEVYNVEYYADAYNEGNVVGNAIASQLDFDLPFMEKFETFRYYDGVWTGEEYEYVDFGEFTVFDEQDEDEFNKHITAFDNLIKFNATFVDNNDYPKTLFEELQNICSQAGVILSNISIANGNFEIENNQFVNNESLKSVLKAICQVSGTYAVIKNDELVLQLQNETDEKITKEHHEPVFWKRRTYGINQVVIGMEDVNGEYVIKQDEEDIAINGVHKMVINDNPFAYTQDKRTQLIDELFEQVRGFGYVPYELNGEWLNYMDIGDTINIDGIDTIILRVTGHSPKALESNMSAPAVIDSAITYVDNTDNIQNQVKRTEIVVDKQNQTIENIIIDINGVNENVSGIYQDIENIVNRVQNSGGSNLIRNSVMFAYDEQNVPTDWQIEGEGTLSMQSSPEAINAGGVSGHSFTLENKIATQRVSVKANTSSAEQTFYTFTTKIKKNITGTCYIKIYNPNEEYIIELNEGDEAYYRDYELSSLLPTMNYYDIEFYGSEDSAATFTDNMFALGEYRTQWTQAQGEIMNTQVNINVNGVLVKSSVYAGDYTIMSPLEFAGYSNINGTITKVFSLNKDVTLVKKLEAEDEINMSPIKIVPIKTYDREGWAFVPSTGGGN